MSKLYKTLTLCTAPLLMAGLTACGNIPDNRSNKLADICKEYCREGGDTRPRVPTVENSGVFVMVKNVQVDDSMQGTPMRQIYVKSKDKRTGEVSLVTPYNPPYGQLLGEQPPETINKSENLDPSCFSTKSYAPTALEEIDLTMDNTTITLINFGEDGRLESLELPKTTGIYRNKKIGKVLQSNTNSTSSPDYEKLQTILSNLVPSDYNAPDWPQPNFPERDLVANNIPLTKTPFYSDLTQTAYKPEEGHIYVYVLADKNIMFTRQYAALVTYAPEVENALMRLYTPFAQYPVYPEIFNESQLDVLTFHFLQSPEAKRSEDKKICNYVYDLHVLSVGQDESGVIGTSGTPAIKEHITPLFIDPEVKSEGVVFGGG